MTNYDLLKYKKKKLTPVASTPLQISRFTTEINFMHDFSLKLMNYNNYFIGILRRNFEDFLKNHIHQKLEISVTK